MHENSTRTRIGLIQPRGIGDIIIALPIAKWHHDRGAEVFWPIDQKFLPSMKEAVDYVNFMPFIFNSTITGYYTKPLELLHMAKCTKIISLYSYLSGLPIYKKELSESLTFDQYKYAISQVPFKEKWNLKIKRNEKREDALYNKLVLKNNYIVIHNKGSDKLVNIEIPAKFNRLQKIFINESTDNIFDWLKIIENAECLFLLDSCFANLVEQLHIKTTKYFIIRSPARFTPILLNSWTHIK